MKNKSRQNRLLSYVFTALMAAMVFVTTYFFHIEIPTPAGPTLLKVSNILVLLGGMLFGGVYGGIAGGMGNCLYDLLDPKFLPAAPLTFIRFFLMGLVCGLISNSGGKKGLSMKRNVIGAVSGGILYWSLYIYECIIKLVISGSTFSAAVIAVSPKMVTSGINQIIAVTGSLLLVIPLHKALRKYLPKFRAGDKKHKQNEAEPAKSE